jgi:membrane protein involved in colicin uptake
MRHLVDTTRVIWLVVAVLALLVVAVLVMSRASGRRTSGRGADGHRTGTRRTMAGHLRDEAAAHDLRIRQEEAHAAKVRERERRAEEAVARQQQEADRLTRLAQERLSGADGRRREREEPGRAADPHDPEVPTAIHGGRYDARMRAERTARERGDEGHDSRPDGGGDG